jgi:hypothetical protein
VFQDTLYRDSDTSFLTLPRLSIGGWGGWSYAIGSTMALRNAAGEEITSYCVFDRDYHPDEEIERRYSEADDRGVNLHIWRRKEIENYLLIPSAIRRVIAAGLGAGSPLPNGEQIHAKLVEIATGFRDDVFDSIAHELLLLDRRSGPTRANQRARERVQEAYSSAEGALAIAPGKSMLAAISAWSQNEFGVSFGALRLARELRRDEIAPEVIAVVRAIELGQAFPKTFRQATTSLSRPCVISDNQTARPARHADAL